jgi:D-alanyl-lipoteichoic acid acyltransferase DltB (MBOAT superfamily)
MSFNALAYYGFLPAVLGLYALVPRRRTAFLLGASLIFYCFAGGWLLPLWLLVTGGATWAIGWRVAGATGGIRRVWLWTGVGLNLALLVACKTQALWHPGATFSVLGVSYFVFQSIAYLADLHWKVTQPEFSLVNFLLYLAFFPRLVEGPVERPKAFLEQLNALRDPTEQDLRAGALRFAWGFFKKAVIAERAAGLARQLLGPIHGQPGPFLSLGAVVYFIQLFFDFSAYTDMAIGSARLFGLRLSENFNAPFFATSTADLWRRWHISFSTWVRDYMFQPLQMELRRLRKTGTLLAMMAVFALVGLWHRLEAGLLVWGLWQGLFMCTGILIRPWQSRFYRAVSLENSQALRAWRMAVTFLMASFALLFVHAPTWALVGDIFQGLTQGWARWKEAVLVLDNGDALVVAGGCALAVSALALRGRVDLVVAPRHLRWPVYYGLALGIFFGAHFFGLRQFIYAQF